MGFYSDDMLFQLVQVIYWLALSTWFGGVLFITAAAPVVLRTVRQSNPVLPHVLSVNLEGQHATLLGGTIIGNLISMLSRIELICAAVLLLTMGGQWFLIDIQNRWNLASAFVRSALYVAATGLVIYDWWFLWPRMWAAREKFIENADDPDIANPAREQFDRYQRESVTLLSTLLFLLLGIVLFSGGMSQSTIITIKGS